MDIPRKGTEKPIREKLTFTLQVNIPSPPAVFCSEYSALTISHISERSPKIAP
jgi:hypothetical protein